MSNERRVCYFYDQDIGNYYYSNAHPMKPHRIRLAHSLIVSTGLYKKLTVLRPSPLSEEAMMKFHGDDFVHFLAYVTPENKGEYLPELKQFGIDDDNPLFDGLFKFCQKYAGGSVGAAARLNRKQADIAINWAGGMGHAKRALASGFSYINDVVLSILELLTKHRRVLYIDMDLTHCGAVEEAFYTTDRVMTLSMHKFGGTFPGTGSMYDIGADGGAGFAVNVPLRAGMDDDNYSRVFKEVVGQAVRSFQPSAVVLQCGANTLSGDRLGCFNLTLEGHGECVKYVRDLHLPLLALGGGGFTVRNVAKCWARATAILLGEETMPAIPDHDEFRAYYAPDYTLSVPHTNAINHNSPELLTKIVSKVLERLQALPEPAEDKQVERKEVHEEAVGEAEGNSEDNGGDQDDDDHEMGVEGGTDANDDQDDTNA